MNDTNSAKKLGFMLVALVATSSVFADDISWNGATDGNWNIGSNWSSGSVPTSNDVAFIRNDTSNPIFQNAQHREVARFAMGILSIPATLNINGGSITAGVTTGTQNSIGQQTNGTTRLNIQGGLLAASNVTAVGGGGDGHTEINLSAGSLNIADANFGNGTGTAAFNMIGDSATMAVGEDWTFGAGGTLNFAFNTSGIQMLSLDSLTVDPASTLSVDLSSYTGAFASFTLLDATAGSGLLSTFANVNVTEGAYAGSFVTQDAGSSLITLNVVPEPSSLALLFVGTAMLLGLRRRKVFA